MSDVSDAPTVYQSLQEYGQGIAGGLLFSLPVLFTMEMWWAGFTSTPLRLLVGLGATLAMLMLYNRYAGLRGSASWREVGIDSVEELGIGLVLSLGLLWLTGRIGFGSSIEELMGKVVLEGMATAIGVSVGTAQLGADEIETSQDESTADQTAHRDETGQNPSGDGSGGDGSGGDDSSESGSGDSSQGMHDRDDEKDDSLLATLSLSVCGAFLVASTVAATEEIPRIASETPYGILIVMAFVSLSLGGLVLYFSDFRGSHRRTDPTWVEMMQGIVVSYAAALGTSGFLLWFFHHFGGASPSFACALIVVLGLPAALGASAGRLLFQGGS